AEPGPPDSHRLACRVHDQPRHSLGTADGRCYADRRPCGCVLPPRPETRDSGPYGGGRARVRSAGQGRGGGLGGGGGAGVARGRGATALVGRVGSGGLLYVLGTGHSQLLALEGYYRAGGPAWVAPVVDLELSPAQGASARASERAAGAGRRLVAEIRAENALL